MSRMEIVWTFVGRIYNGYMFHEIPAKSMDSGEIHIDIVYLDISIHYYRFSFFSIVRLTSAKRFRLGGGKAAIPPNISYECELFINKQKEKLNFAKIEIASFSADAFLFSIFNVILLSPTRTEKIEGLHQKVSERHLVVLLILYPCALSKLSNSK